MKVQFAVKKYRTKSGDKEGRVVRDYAVVGTAVPIDKRLLKLLVKRFESAQLIF